MNPVSSQLLGIDYQSEGFPSGSPVSNGYGTLDTSWGELLWAAITVGRPDRMYVFRYGHASTYEALFRLSLVRMALEQSGPRAFRLRRTDAVKTLYPSEKGAVNYFLGMTLCKLFAAKLLNTPWVMHLDVFRPQINAVLTGRSRPDLMGQSSNGEWIVLESKGRVSAPDRNVKTKAKQQATRVVSVNGQRPACCIGGITYFRNDTLQYYWCDPEPPQQEHQAGAIKITAEENIWIHYYAPLVELFKSIHHDSIDNWRNSIFNEQLDIGIKIYEPLFKLLLNGEYIAARKICYENSGKMMMEGFKADGIQIIAGASWQKPFVEFNKYHER